MAVNRESTIQIMYSATGGVQPTPTDLEYGELAINIADGKVYYRGDDDSLKTFEGATPIGYTAGNDPPVGSNTGDFWYENDTGLYYAYVWDGSTLGWLQISGQDGATGATAEIVDSYLMLIESPTDKDYTLDSRVVVGRTITEFYAKTGTGGCTLELKNATTTNTIATLGASSTGLTASSLSNVSVSQYDRLVIGVTGNASTEDLEIMVGYTQ